MYILRHTKLPDAGFYINLLTYVLIQEPYRKLHISTLLCCFSSNHMLLGCLDRYSKCLTSLFLQVICRTPVSLINASATFA